MSDVDYLEEAKCVLKGFSGKVQDLERARVYALIAVAETARAIEGHLQALNLHLTTGGGKVAEVSPVSEKVEGEPAIVPETPKKSRRSSTK